MYRKYSAQFSNSSPNSSNSVSNFFYSYASTKQDSTEAFLGSESGSRNSSSMDGDISSSDEGRFIYFRWILLVKDLFSLLLGWFRVHGSTQIVCSKGPLIECTNLYDISKIDSFTQSPHNESFGFVLMFTWFLWSFMVFRHSLFYGTMSFAQRCLGFLIINNQETLKLYAFERICIESQWKWE